MMQTKHSLIGALVGAAIGIGVLIAAYFLFRIEHTLLAVVVALLVGVGVRTAVATKGHASYTRGALTAFVAIAAFVGGKYVVAAIAEQRSATNAVALVKNVSPPPAEEDKLPADNTDTPSLQSSSQVEPRESSMQQVESSPAANAPRFAQKHVTKLAFSIWDFVWLVIAALVAYELGRGSGKSLPVGPETHSNAALA